MFIKNIPKTHMITKEDLPLVQFTHTFAQASVWLEEDMQNRIATYDLYVREMPPKRNFLVAGGLEEILFWLKELKFSDTDIDYLLKTKLITKKFAKYLKNFKFSGTVYAMPEGTICFPGEPVIRVTAPLVEASLIEAYLINALTSNMIFLSKAVRCKIAARDKFRLSTGILRAHSFESGIKAARSGYICGISSMATPAVSKKYHISHTSYVVNAQHLFVTSFVDELTAFRALAKYFPANSSFMVDTYDIRQGIANAILVAKELQTRGYALSSITIDSGDLIKLAIYARRQLDQNGFKNVKIILAGNLDEYKIYEIFRRKAPCDIAVVGTEYVTVRDSPKLEVVYKLSEIKNENKVIYTAKLSPGKIHYPGRKQVFRIFRNGKMVKDIIGLENEKLGEPLLKKFMENGKIVGRLPSLEEIKTYLDAQLKQIPKRFLSIKNSTVYPVLYSSSLKRLLEKVKKTHCEK